MYDELAKRLRNCSTQAAPCKTCDLIEDGSCSDTLMKQAADAIEELQKAVLRLEEASGILDELPMYQQPVGWIPVTEWLPESVHEYVLCCGAKGGQFVGWVGTGFITGGKVMAFQHGGKGRYITHWMPLPEPPKEGET